MKKENKRMAQERRAQERKKQEQKKKLQTALMIGIPALLLLVVLALIFINPKEEPPVLSTDKTLEVKDGDTVNIDYVGKIDGVAFAGGDTKGQGTDLTIGTGMYIDDFEEQLIGAHVGDTVKVEVTFPENYGNKDLNGKDAVFEVVINGIYQ